MQKQILFMQKKKLMYLKRRRSFVKKQRSGTDQQARFSHSRFPISPPKNKRFVDRSSFVSISFAEFKIYLDSAVNGESAPTAFSFFFHASSFQDFSRSLQPFPFRHYFLFRTELINARVLIVSSKPSQSYPGFINLIPLFEPLIVLSF